MLTALEIARGLEYLHHPDRRMVHRDLSAANVLLTTAPGDERGFRALLSDFGGWPGGLSRAYVLSLRRCSAPRFAAQQALSCGRIIGRPEHQPEHRGHAPHKRGQGDHQASIGGSQTALVCN